MPLIDKLYVALDEAQTEPLVMLNVPPPGAKGKEPWGRGAVREVSTVSDLQMSDVPRAGAGADLSSCAEPSRTRNFRRCWGAVCRWRPLEVHRALLA